MKLSQNLQEELKISHPVYPKHFVFSDKVNIGLTYFAHTFANS